MPTGPKGEKRPADVIGNAIKVARIATGEEQEEYDAPPEKNAAAELGRKGGRASGKHVSGTSGGDCQKSCGKALEKIVHA